MTFSGRARLTLPSKRTFGWVGLVLACAAPVPSRAQTAPAAKRPVPQVPPATRPQPVPKANVAPKAKISVTPSKKPLPPAQLEEALRLLLRADSTSLRAPRPGAEAAGLVLDQAISKLGHDFYDLFYSLFEAPADVADFTIVVSERPGRANANLVVVTVNDAELLELPLATRFEQLQETVLYAVGTAQDYLAEAQSVSRQLEAGHKAPLETF